MPLGFILGRPFTPLRVATSARSSAIVRFSAAFSASNRPATASSSPRGRPERVIFPEADMAGTSRGRSGSAQPRQLTSARPFAPRTGVNRCPLSNEDIRPALRTAAFPAAPSASKEQTMSDVTVFKFGDEATLRAVEIDGQPWFPAADVCRCLDMDLARGTYDWVRGLDAA